MARLVQITTGKRMALSPQAETWVVLTQPGTSGGLGPVEKAGAQFLKIDLQVQVQRGTSCTDLLALISSSRNTKPTGRVQTPLAERRKEHGIRQPSSSGHCEQVDTLVQKISPSLD